MDKLKVSKTHERTFLDKMFSMEYLQEKRLDSLSQFNSFITFFNHEGLRLWVNMQKEIEDNCMLLSSSDKIGYLKRLYQRLYQLQEEWRMVLESKYDDGETITPYKYENRFGNYSLPNVWLKRYYNNCLFRVIHMAAFVQEILRSEGVSGKELLRFVSGDEQIDGENNNDTCPPGNFVSPYDFSNLTEIMTKAKAEEFELIEANLLQFKFIDKDRKWKGKLNELAAFVHALDRYQYLKDRTTLTQSMRLKRAKRLFSTRYDANLKAQGRSSIIEDKLPNLIKGLEFVFSIDKET